MQGPRGTWIRCTSNTNLANPVQPEISNSFGPVKTFLLFSERTSPFAPQSALLVSFLLPLASTTTARLAILRAVGSSLRAV